MRFLRSVLLASSCLLSSLSAAESAVTPDEDGAATAEQRRPHEVYTMGFEAETSAYKMSGDTQKRVFVELFNCEEFWEFTVDTPDYSHLVNKQSGERKIEEVEDTEEEEVEETEEIGNVLNTESKTIGGLDQKRVLMAIEKVRKVWDKLRELCEITPDQYVDIPENVFENILSPSFRIKISFDPKLPRGAEGESDAKSRVYNQITYCLPVSKFHLIFDRLFKLNLTTSLCRYYKESNLELTTLRSDSETEALLGKLLMYIKETSSEIENKLLEFDESEAKREEDLGRFKEQIWADLSRLKKERSPEEYKKLSKRYKKSLKEKEEANDIARFRERRPILNLRTKLSNFMKELLILKSKPIFQQKNTPSGGLAYLVVYYAYTLFCENAHPIKSEPGAKPYLGVMSRMPFSEMYDKLPSADEKDSFKALIDGNLQEFFNVRLYQYKSCAGVILHERERITFREWFESIIDPSTRNKDRDLLSPPPGCRLGISEPPYGMGAYSNKIQSLGHGLLEVRDYTQVLLKNEHSGKEENTTLDSSIKLIQNESDWFFNVVAERGEAA